MEEQTPEVKYADVRALLANADATHEELYQAFRKYNPRHAMVRTMAIARAGAKDHLRYQLDKMVANHDAAEAQNEAFSPAREKILAEAAAREKAEADLMEQKIAAEEERDNAVLPILQERSRLIGERAKVQNTLADLQTDEERQAALAEIDRLSAEIGNLNATQEENLYPIPATKEEIIHALNLAQGRRSKHVKLLKDEPQNKLVPKWQEKVEYETAYIEKLTAARDNFGNGAQAA